MEPMIPGPTDGLNIDERDFFNAAKSGNKKILKKLVDSGKIHDIDTKNEWGQTPLFFACFDGAEECVKYLLEQGANPNEPTEQGQTPLHAACFHACIKSVSALVEKGGDFRFHDKEQRTAKDWAMLNPNAKKRQLMTEYIVKTRMFAMTHSGRDVLLEQQSSIYMRRPSDNAGSMAQLFKRISSKGGGKAEHLRTSASLMSLGYGKVYGGEKGGTFSTIPMVAESMLKHDDFGTTFMNGAFFVMEGMMLGPTKVTVKRLHHDPPKGGVVDLLIRECENIAHLRHPSVLLLMATCATDNMEGMVLLFERVSFGSLYNYLHEKNQQPAQHAIIEAGLQLCEGLIYIHQNNFIHCYFSSHSLFLTSCNILKIGNFEYMVPMTIGSRGARLPGVSSNKYLNATYNWMSPEIIKEELPTEKSDVYSFCAVMWEMFTGNIPWVGHDAEQIKRQVCGNKMLKVNDSHIPSKFVEVLTYGLQPSPSNRRMNFEQIRDVLSLMPRGRPEGGKSVSPVAQMNNHCSVDSYDPMFSGSSFIAYSGTSGAEWDTSVTSRCGWRCDKVRRRKPRYNRHSYLHHRYTQTLKPHDVGELVPYRDLVDFEKRAMSSPPLAPRRKKHYMASDMTSDSLTTFSVFGSESLFSVQKYQRKGSQTDPHTRELQNRLQLCIALKAPIHQELKTYYAEIREEMSAKEHATHETKLPEGTLNPQQPTLQKQLNKELHDIFSGFDNEFASLDLSELDDLCGSSASGIDVETNLSVQTDKPLTQVAHSSARSEISSAHADYSSIWAENSLALTDNPSTQADNISARADNPSARADNPSAQACNLQTRANFLPAKTDNSSGPMHMTELHGKSRSSRINTRRSKSMSTISTKYQKNELGTPPFVVSLKTSYSSASLSKSSFMREAVKPASHVTVGRQTKSRTSLHSQDLISLRSHSSTSLPAQPGPMAALRSRATDSSWKDLYSISESEFDGEPAYSAMTLIKAASLPSGHITMLDGENSVTRGAHRNRYEPYQRVNGDEGSELSASSFVEAKSRSSFITSANEQRSTMPFSMDSAPKKINDPRTFIEKTPTALRYIGRSAAITEQVPVVDRIKKLDKLYGKCKSDELALDRWKSSSREYEQSAICSSSPSQHDKEAKFTDSKKLNRSDDSIESRKSIHLDFSQKRLLFEQSPSTVSANCHAGKSACLKMSGRKSSESSTARGRNKHMGVREGGMERCTRNKSRGGTRKSTGVRCRARQPGVGAACQPVVGGVYRSGVGDGIYRTRESVRKQFRVCPQPISPSVSAANAEDSLYGCSSNMLNSDIPLKKTERPVGFRSLKNRLQKNEGIPKSSARFSNAVDVTDCAVEAVKTREICLGQCSGLLQTSEDQPLNILSKATSFQPIASLHKRKQSEWSKNLASLISEPCMSDNCSLNPSTACKTAKCDESSATESDAQVAGALCGNIPTLPEVPLRASHIIQAINSAVIDKEMPGRNFPAVERKFPMCRNLVNVTECPKSHECSSDTCDGHHDCNPSRSGNAKATSHCASDREAYMQQLKGDSKSSAVTSKDLLPTEDSRDVAKPSLACESEEGPSSESHTGNANSSDNNALLSQHGPGSSNAAYDAPQSLSSVSSSHSSNSSLSTDDDDKEMDVFLQNAGDDTQEISHLLPTFNKLQNENSNESVTYNRAGKVRKINLQNHLQSSDGMPPDDGVRSIRANVDADRRCANVDEESAKLHNSDKADSIFDENSVLLTMPCREQRVLGTSRLEEDPPRLEGSSSPYTFVDSEYLPFRKDTFQTSSDPRLRDDRKNNEVLPIDRNAHVTNPQKVADIPKQSEEPEQAKLESVKICPDSVKSSLRAEDKGKISYRYNLTANYQLLDSEEEGQQQVEILCNTTPRLPRVTKVGAFSGAAKAFITEADEDTAHIVLEGENGRSCKVKLNRTHTVTRQDDGTDVIITKHNISTEMTSMADKVKPGDELTDNFMVPPVVPSPAAECVSDDVDSGGEATGEEHQIASRDMLVQNTNRHPVLNELAGALSDRESVEPSHVVLDENNNAVRSQSPTSDELSGSTPESGVKIGRPILGTKEMKHCQNSGHGGNQMVVTDIDYNNNAPLGGYEEMTRSSLAVLSLRPSSDLLRCRKPSEDRESFQSHCSEMTDFLELPPSLHPQLPSRYDSALIFDTVTQNIRDAEVFESVNDHSKLLQK